MPFLPSSRYARAELVTVTMRDGRTITAIKLRRLPAPQAAPHVVDAEARLDTIARDAYGDATRGWHIADANTELEARALATPGRVIRKPGQP